LYRFSVSSARRGIDATRFNYSKNFHHEVTTIAKNKKDAANGKNVDISLSP